MKPLHVLVPLFALACVEELATNEHHETERRPHTGARIDETEAHGPLRRVATGFGFTEGPAWFSDRGVLRFTDKPASRIHQLDPAGGISVWRSATGSTNGLGVTPDQELIACESGNRRVTRFSNRFTFEVVADNYSGDSLNGPNDNVVRSDGTIYFTDPNYGLPPGDQELPFQGVFRVDPDGELFLVDDRLENPNGIALSPDESTLYVIDTPARIVYAVLADGSTGLRSTFVDTESGPDGMAVDDDGKVFVATVAGIDVYQSDGTQIDTIAVPEKPANCTFGGFDRRTLFIAAMTSLYKVRMDVPGLP